MSYYGAEKVIDNYGVMGPIKACLEASVRYMSTELARSKIRVFAISAGPIATRAASGLKDFDKIAQKAEANSPMGRLVTTDEVGNVSVFLVSDLSAGMTGQTIYVDCGASVIW
jgi:enoyl-[acyl-carrier protein] reductase I